MYSFLCKLLILSSVVVAQTCYYPDGSVASELAPCNPDMATGSTGSACCPLASASDLYPLDYPNCTPDALCKAGNSDFFARGGCTDSFFNEAACPGYCIGVNRTSMAGITDCGDGGPWYCCDADHDAGRCTCNPPSGLAFELSGNPTPILYANSPDQTSSVVPPPSFSSNTQSSTQPPGPVAAPVTTSIQSSTIAPVAPPVTTETVLVVATEVTVTHSTTVNPTVSSTLSTSSSSTAAAGLNVSVVKWTAITLSMVCVFLLQL